MKNLWIAYLISSLLLACNGKTKEASSHHSSTGNFTLSIKDTLHVDADNRFLYLNRGLAWADWDPQSHTLYNFNPMDHSLELIHINSLRLTGKIPLEKEGPQGTGQVYAVSVGDNGKVLLKGYRSISLTDSTGRILAHLDNSKLRRDEETLGPGESIPWISGVLDKEGDYFFAPYTKGDKVPLGLIKIDLTNFESQKIPIPNLQSLREFVIRLHLEHGTSPVGPNLYLSRQDHCLLLTSNAVNEAYLYDITKEELSHFSFDSQFTANRWENSKKKECYSEAELAETIKEMSKQGHFSPMLFDASKGLYYRFSSNQVNANKIFSVFDKDLNLLFETDQVSEKIGGRTLFAHDGKIYFFNNIDDELALAVVAVEEI